MRGSFPGGLFRPSPFCLAVVTGVPCKLTEASWKSSRGGVFNFLRVMSFSRCLELEIVDSGILISSNAFKN